MPCGCICDCEFEDCRECLGWRCEDCQDCSCGCHIDDDDTWPDDDEEGTE